MKHINKVGQIEHFTEFELMDRPFIQTLATIEEPIPYLKGIVTELDWTEILLAYTMCRGNGRKALLPLIFPCSMIAPCAVL